MKTTPMHAYSSVTTARVMPPQPPTKPAAYASRFAKHIAKGKTPADAMRLIEREDGHTGKLPINKAYTTTADMILPHLSREWTTLAPDFCEAVGAQHDTIRMALKIMVTAGLVEGRQDKCNSPSMWRLP